MFTNNRISASLIGMLIALTTSVSASEVKFGAKGGVALPVVNNAYTTDSGIGLGLYADFAITPYIAVETAYNYYASIGLKDKDAQADSNASDLLVYGPELAIKGKYLFKKINTEVFAKAGAFYSIYNVQNSHKRGKRLAPTLGLGVDYSINENVDLRLGYDFTYKATSNNNAGMSLNLIYFGIGVKFGGDSNNNSKANTDVAPVMPQTIAEVITPAAKIEKKESKAAEVVPEKSKAPTISTINFDAESLFAFGSDVLSVQGYTAIAKAIKNAQTKDHKNLEYSVKGHSDNIGNPAYNKKLSLKRAQSVAEALLDIGVKKNQIKDVVGVGSSESTLANKCEGLARPEKIICSAPDRRVEINIKGIKINK